MYGCPNVILIPDEIHTQRLSDLRRRHDTLTEYMGPFNKFPDFFVQAFKIVEDSWKFSMWFLYILSDDWPIFMISASNEQLQQQFECTLLKPECHSRGISKMQSRRDDTLEERYAIKFCFKLGKMPQKRMECFRLLFDHLAWIEHEFLSGIKGLKEDRESVSDGERCGRSKEVNTPELIGQRVRVRVTVLRFKGVQEEIASAEASTLQIGSVAFPPGQCTNSQLHPCHKLFDQDGHQDIFSPYLLSRACSLRLFGYSLCSEAVVMR